MSCQRLAVSEASPYNLWPHFIPVGSHGGLDEFSSSAVQKRRAG